MESLGKAIVGLGVILVLVGLSLWFFSDKFGWFGHLPGDIRVEREGFRLYAPITTMLIVSVILSVILSIISRLIR